MSSAYLYAGRTLPPDERSRAQSEPRTREPLDRAEWRTLVSLLILCLPLSLFWATYEQQGNTIALWAEDHTDRSVNLILWSGEIPTTWFQAVNPLLIFAFTPLIVGLWARQARRTSEPSTGTKMTLGCLGVAVAYLIMAFAAFNLEAGGKASWLWLLAYFVVDHDRRVVCLADRSVAGLEGCPRSGSLVDHGPVAGNKLSGQLDVGLAGELLGQHREDAVLSDGGVDCCPRQRRHVGLLPAAQGRS